MARSTAPGPRGDRRTMTSRHPRVRTAADLEAVWRRLIEPLGFGSRQIFAIMLSRDGEVFPSIVNVTDCPSAPDELMLENLASGLREGLDAMDAQGSCAVFWARPTPGGTRATDVAWARALGAAMAKYSLGDWPIHVADDFVLRVVTPDDLAA